MIRNKHRYLHAFGIIFVVLSVIKLGGIFTVKVPWISDEAGVWQIANFFGGNGKNWISYIENSGRHSDYYGLFTSLIYSPFINSFNNIIIGYRCCLLINIFMLVVMAFISFRVLYDWFKLDYAYALICSISTVALYAVLFHANVIMTETVLTTWIWGVIYYFIFIINHSTSVKHTLFFSLLMILGYIIHSRCLILWGMVLFAIIIYRIIEKKWIVNPSIFVGIFFGMYIGFSKLSDLIQKFFWSSSELKNTTENAASKITIIFQVLQENFEGVYTIFISLLAEFTIETCGIIIICILVSIAYFEYIFQRIKERKWNSEDSKILCYFIIMCGSFIAMNFCIAINSHSPSRSKWFVYTRYATPFLGMYIMYSFYLLKRMKINLNRLIWYSIFIISFLFKWIITYWPDLLSDAQMGKFDSAFFLGYKIMAVIHKFGVNGWILSIICVFLLGISIILFALKKNYDSIVPLILTLYSLTLYYLAITSYVTPGQFSNNYWSKVDRLYECCKQYDLQNYEIKYCGNADVYLPTQLVLGKYDLECVKDFYEIQNEKIIFFSDIELEEKISKWVIKLDDGEYIYTSNHQLKNELSEQYEVIQ